MSEPRMCDVFVNDDWTDGAQALICSPTLYDCSQTVELAREYGRGRQITPQTG
ncbi:MAG: hypothetical protein VB934_22000 [Polyangiaceae bacterium]